MAKQLAITVFLVAALTLLTDCGSAPHLSKITEARVARLHAFARLYGIVRWFHPSDLAAEADWDQFAVDGAALSIAVDDDSFESALRRFFKAIAPSVIISRDGQDSAAPGARVETLLHASSNELVAWEHLGYGDTVFMTGYASKRRHRSRRLPINGEPYAALWQAVDGQPLRGKKVRFSGSFRGAGNGCGALWLRVERPSGRGFFENMTSHPVLNKRWASGEIVGTVDGDASRIVFGIYKEGGATCWYDDLHLEVEDGTSWRPIQITNPSFEEADVLEAWKPGIGRGGNEGAIDGWLVETDHAMPAVGASALRIQPQMQLQTAELFDDHPERGEMTVLELGMGLRARVPLVLPSRDGKTLDAALTSPAIHEALRQADESAARAADVIVLWNAIQHFWPYWQTFQFDWMAQLDLALAAALENQDVEHHQASLRRMMATVPDGHVQVKCPTKSVLQSAAVEIDEVEGKLLVIAADGANLAPGDELIEVDGIPAVRRRDVLISSIAGSLQLRKARAHERITEGPAGSRARLRVKRDMRIIDVDVEREGTTTQARRPSIDHLEGNIYYIDLSRVTATELDPILPELASATGIVFDMRARPRDGEYVLSHLLMSPMGDEKWLSTPHVIRPDHSDDAISGWTMEGWNLPMLEPRIRGRIAFLSGPRTMSYSESLLGYISAYRLGAIVGSTSAGTNGDIAAIGTPSGCQSWFTGARVTALDGSQVLMRGFAPTIPVARTIAGVTAGRDEELDRALVYIRTLN